MKLVIAFICLVPSCFSVHHSNRRAHHDDEIHDIHCEEIRQKLSSDGRTLKKAETSNSTIVTPSQILATRQGACSCGGGLCACCSRLLFDVWKQKACVNVTYDPDEFSFTAKIMMNDRVLYTRTMSGKNPRPICVPVPRFPALRACVKFYNIYFQGRNVHVCISMEGKFRNTLLFRVGLDCVRFGTNGVAIVKPEDGGGLGQVEFLPGDASAGDDNNYYDENDYSVEDQVDDDDDNDDGDDEDDDDDY